MFHGCFFERCFHQICIHKEHKFVKYNFVYLCIFQTNIYITVIVLCIYAMSSVICGHVPPLIWTFGNIFHIFCFISWLGHYLKNILLFHNLFSTFLGKSLQEARFFFFFFLHNRSLFSFFCIQCFLISTLQVVIAISRFLTFLRSGISVISYL